MLWAKVVLVTGVAILATSCSDKVPGCTIVECLRGVTVRAYMPVALPDGTYDVLVEANDDAELVSFTMGQSLECGSDACVRCTESLCIEVIGVTSNMIGVRINNGSLDESGPLVLTVAVDYEGERIGDEVFMPTYVETFPNGPDCFSGCLQASEEMTLAEPVSSPPAAVR